MSTLSKQAMLVSLTVRSYGAKKEDKKISADVAAQHNVAADTGKYSKVLVPKNRLDPITKAVSALRMFHYENTLPWLDEGVRILPAANYERYKSQMNTLADGYDSAVREFVSAWPEIIADARVRLNGMFDVRDYPVDIKSRFGCASRFMPMPDQGDFRVEISDQERETLRAQIAETLGEAQTAAMRDLWERVAQTVKAMAERLSAYKTHIENGKVKTENPFRDSLVENLRDLCALIPRLNFANDARLEAIRQQIESELLVTTAQALRDDFNTRESVAHKAEAIAAAISEFME